ncbi:MAG: Cas10/Cmr2 second palm domain-containing protein [Actinomycetota bacterium]
MRWLVLHDVDRIQEFVFGVPRLREIRGASALIEDLNRNQTERQIATSGGEKIYVGGGGAAAWFADEPSARRFERAVSRAYSEASGAGSTGAVTAYDPSAGGNSFQDALHSAHRRLRAAKAAREVSTQVLTSPFFARCRLCGQEAASGRRGGAADEGPALICHVCQARGGSVFRPLQRRVVEAVNRARGLELRPVEDLSEIGRASEGYIGVVYADGNRMGERLLRIRTEPSLQGFSDAVRGGVWAAVTAVAGGLAARDREYLPAEVPLVGGDDVIMIVPADRALEAAENLVRTAADAIHAQMPAGVRSELGEQAQVSLCAGVVIAKDHVPIAGLVDLAHELCNTAKGRYRHELEKAAGDREPACIDFQVITTASWRSESDHAELYHLGDRRLTSRPYTSTELTGLLQAARLLDEAGVPNGKLGDLYRSFWQGPARARAAYHTLLMRSTREQLEALWGAEPLLGLGVEAPWKTDWSGRGSCTPFPDLIELLPFLTRSGHDIVSAEGE